MLLNRLALTLALVNVLAASVSRAEVGVQWDVTFPQSVVDYSAVTGVVADPGGGAAVLGPSAPDPITGATSPVVFKIGADGAFLWSRIVMPGTTMFDQADAGAIDNLGNLYVAANVDTTWNGKTVLMKYSVDGLDGWPSPIVIDGPVPGYNDYPRGIATDGERVWVVMASYGPKTGWDYLTHCYDANGVLLWKRRLSSQKAVNSLDEPAGIVVLPAGKAWVTGKVASANGKSDIATIVYDDLGQTEFIRVFDGVGGGFDEAADIRSNSQGTVAIAGMSQTLGVNRSIVLAYDGNGSLLWKSLDGPEQSTSLAQHLAVNSAGSVAVGSIDALPVAGMPSPAFHAITRYFDASGNLLWSSSPFGSPVGAHANHRGVEMFSTGALIDANTIPLFDVALSLRSPFGSPVQVISTLAGESTVRTASTADGQVAYAAMSSYLPAVGIRVMRFGE